jgi:acyl-CoA thioesterase
MTAREFLGLQPTDDPARWRMPIAARVLTHAGAVQGGAAFAAAVETMEAVTERPLVWASAQFLRHAGPGGRLDVDVSVEMSGRQTTQARARVRLDDTEVLSAWGALGARPFEGTGAWPTVPDIPPPEASGPPLFPPTGDGDITTHLEIRQAMGRTYPELDGTRSSGRWAAWCRRVDDAGPISAGDLALIGDLSMLAFSDALGRRCTGNSLDNSLRVAGGAAAREAAGWVLLDVRVEAVHDGFGHAHAYLWNEDGSLLGISSQTLVLRDADPSGRAERRGRRIVGR